MNAVKHVTLMREDRRRKPAVTVYCLKCDWTYKTNDRIDAYKVAKSHDAQRAGAK